jgi:cysteine desulfurase
MIYFDNNATTRVAPEAVKAMQPFLDGEYGNPSSAHAAGRAAKAAVAHAREFVADLVGAAAEEVVFTGTGTEADNWAIIAAVGEKPWSAHIVTSTVEHDAVARAFDMLERGGCRVTRVPVDGRGCLDLDYLRTSLGTDTKLVSIMLANNETGVIFPIDEIGRIVKEHSNAVFHVDGVNAVGKIPVDLRKTQVDLFSLAGHKFHGPKGIGALYIRRGMQLSPITLGGGQEFGLRSGTEAVHQIVGLGAAAKLASDLSSADNVRILRDRLETGICETISDTRLNGSPERDQRLPNTSSICFAGLNGEMLMARLDAAGVCVSTGSACHTQGAGASVVLQAMNVPFEFARGAIRFSLGRYNTDAELDTVLGILPNIVRDLRNLSGD